MKRRTTCNEPTPNLPRDERGRISVTPGENYYISPELAALMISPERGQRFVNEVLEDVYRWKLAKLRQYQADKAEMAAWEAAEAEAGRAIPFDEWEALRAQGGKTA